VNTIVTRLIAIAALIAGLYFAERHIEGIGYDRAKAEYTAAIDKQKADAAATLATETAKVRQAEQALQAATDAQNQKDQTHAKTIADLSSRLRLAAGPAGRLRDPHAAGCGAGSSGPEAQAASAAGDRATDRTEAGGLVSEPLSRLLLELTASADEVNAAYASCRTWVNALAVQP
jgi:hypothetical protein